MGINLQRMKYKVTAQVTAADLGGVYGWNNEGQMTSMTQPKYYTGAGLARDLGVNWGKSGNLGYALQQFLQNNCGGGPY